MARMSDGDLHPSANPCETPNALEEEDQFQRASEGQKVTNICHIIQYI